MKKFLKILAVIFLLLIIILVAIPFIYKDKIVAKAKAEINKTINAKVNFGDFDLTIISSFPNLTFKLNDFSIIGIDDFKDDTLAYISRLNLALNIWDVVGGSQMKIKSIGLDKPYINIIVLKNGKANYDITKPDSSAAGTSEPSSFKLALQKYYIENGLIKYDDQSTGMKMEMQNFNHHGSGDFTQDVFILETKTEIDKTTFSYGGVKYLSEAKTRLDANLDMDMKNMKFAFKENELALNELVLDFNGWIAMPTEDITMDMKFDLKKNDFKDFISMIPGLYREGFKDLKSSGKLALNGFIKGTYNEKQMPGFGLNLKIDNGMFQYPALPTGVNNVNVDLNVTNPDGVPDHTIINLNKMHVELGSDPFDAHLYVTTPVSDANMDLAVNGTVNLAHIKNIVPLDAGTDLNGILKADLKAKGRYSAIEQKRYEDFNASGTLSLAGIKYTSKDMPSTTINNLLLTFNPKNVTLNSFDAKIGRSDLNASGTIDNLLAYYFKNETIKGSFKLKSSLLDLNEFTGNSASTTTATTPTDTSKMSVIEIPSNIDFALNVAVQKLIYDNMLIENLSGEVTMKEQALNMNNLSFNTIGGSVKLNGKYATPNPKQPDFNYTLTLANFDIQQTFKTFNTVKKLAPVAEHCFGKFNTNFSVDGKFDQFMQPDLNALTGNGKMSTASVSITNVEALNKLADALKMDQYKKLDLKNLNISYEFKDGRVYAKPFETSFHNCKAKIQGSNGFDQTIDYTMNLEIPKKEMNQQALGMVTGLLSKANSMAGTNLSISDPVKVNVYFGGTVSKPTVKTDLNKSGQNIVQDVKQQVVDKAKEELEKQKANARAEADKILKDAEVKAQQIRDAAKAAADQAKKEGYAQADKFVNDQKNPIAKVAAKETAKKLKSEADKQSQKIIDEGNKSAQKVLDEAKKKSDDMLK